MQDIHITIWLTLLYCTSSCVSILSSSSSPSSSCEGKCQHITYLVLLMLNVLVEKLMTMYTFLSLLSSL
jgi:hypothetical protein